MFVKQGFFGAIGLALLALGTQLPVRAQSLPETKLPISSQAYQTPLNEVASYEVTADSLAAQPSPTAAQALTDDAFAVESNAAESNAVESGAVESDAVESDAIEPTATEAELAYPATEETELAQSRRRTRRTASGAPAFIGIGADLGTTDNVSFAVISKLALGQQLAIRPSVLLGEDFAVLVPITYEFSQFNTEAGRFQVRPYAGAGASYIDQNDSSEVGLLLAGGVDIPISQRFTANAQANYAGIFSDSENFGVTLGVGYNFGGL